MQGMLWILKKYIEDNVTIRSSLLPILDLEHLHIRWVKISGIPIKFLIIDFLAAAYKQMNVEIYWPEVFLSAVYFYCMIWQWGWSDMIEHIFFYWCLLKAGTLPAQPWHNHINLILFYSILHGSIIGPN